VDSESGATRRADRALCGGLRRVVPSTAPVVAGSDAAPRSPAAVNDHWTSVLV